MKTSFACRLWFCLVFALGSARAADRVAAILAPAEVKPGSEVSIILQASTDATDGEAIKFLHSEYSIDGGKNWRPLCYLENADVAVERPVSVTAGSAPSMIAIRMRVAFRGGRSGDVDYRGKRIDWEGTWADWRAPAARFAIIYVR